MGDDDIRAIHAKLDAMSELMHGVQTDRAVADRELVRVCESISDLHTAVMGPDGLATRLTRAEGKISVGQWVLVTFGTALIGCLVGASWALAVRV